jgi:hypothetical protein
MALNLSRSSRLFVVNTYKNDKTAERAVINDAASGLAATNMLEIPILASYSFSQASETQEITVSEAGDDPVRGQRIFNTAINPGEFSFTSYVRNMQVYKDDENNTNADVVTSTVFAGFEGMHILADMPLWLAAVSDKATEATNTPISAHTSTVIQAGSTTSTTTRAPARVAANNYRIVPGFSNKNQLGKLDFFLVIDNVVYRLGKSAINTIELDFSIDGIAMVTYTGFCETVKDVSEDFKTLTIGNIFTSAFTTVNKPFNNINGVALPSVSSGTATVDPKLIINKLSTVLIVRNTETTPRTFKYTNTAGIKLTDTVNQPLAIAFDTNKFITSKTGSSITVKEAIDQVNTNMALELLPWYLSLSDDGKTFYLENTSLNISNPKDLDNTTLTAPTMDITINGLIFDITITPIASTGTSTEYKLALTGGSITISNNITYLTPEELARVNKPLDHFTGTRTISGSFTAYLRSGRKQSSSLLKGMVEGTTYTEEKFGVILTMGGDFNTANTLSVIMPRCHLSIPTINVDDVISTEITMTGLGTKLDANNEFIIYGKA